MSLEKMRYLKIGAGYPIDVKSTYDGGGRGNKNNHTIVEMEKFFVLNNLNKRGRFKFFFFSMNYAFMYNTYCILNSRVQTKRVQFKFSTIQRL